MGKPSNDKQKRKQERKAMKREAMAELFGALHPKLALLLERLPPGRYAGGALILTPPGAHHEEMSRWLAGRVEGRVALGRTAFGDILVFRDLRKKAYKGGYADPLEACDVALIDLNFKQMHVLAYSVEIFLNEIDNTEFQNVCLRKQLYDEVKIRIGDYSDDEAYAFVPALALGGAEEAGFVERAKWQQYQDILFQLR